MFAPIEMWLIPDLFQYPGFSFMMPNVGPFSDILQTNTEFCQQNYSPDNALVHQNTTLLPAQAAVYRK